MKMITFRDLSGDYVCSPPAPVDNTSDPAVVRSLHVCSVTESFGVKLLVYCAFLKLEGGVSGCLYQAKLN